MIRKYILEVEYEDTDPILSILTLTILQEATRMLPDGVHIRLIIPDMEKEQ